PLYLHLELCFFFLLYSLIASFDEGVMNLTMDSQNMNHLLRWTLPAASCRPVYSSVQFQGEWELLYLNGSWEDVHMCQRIVLNMCDVTSDLATDSDYNLRVRLECDGHLSPWEHLREPFNRRKSKTPIKPQLDSDQILTFTAVVGVVLLASLLVWSAKRWTPVVWYTCFAKESLPITLVSSHNACNHLGGRRVQGHLFLISQTSRRRNYKLTVCL
uniref:Fibronectin type-III domain-containing protein n=1 Tax=Denticeps clupeoides TaxID=299321 RepID=A0AAY4AVL0_9TELE